MRNIDFIMKIALCVALVSVSMAANSQDHIYVYQGGHVVYTEYTDSIDYVALEEDNTVVTLYNAAGEVLYTAAKADIDSLTFTYHLPVADLLDVEFQADGTAIDVSPLGNTIEAVEGSTYYSEVYQRYVANFDVNTWAAVPSSYYKVDYSSSDDFKEGLSGGHTLEVVVMANYEEPISDSEAKFFSAHESGGTGLMLCTTSRGLDGGNEFTFLPNVTTSGSSTWRWAVSGVVPEPGVYYHVVGVWSQEDEKARIYVNGELKNEVDAPGDFLLPTNTDYQWFGIGCDAGPTAQLGWVGDVVIARVYSEPLSQSDIELLYNDIIDNMGEETEALVSSVSYYSGLAVKSGVSYPIEGTGFETGDVVLFQSVTDDDNSYSLDVTLNGSDGVFVTIPDAMTTDRYRMYVQRDDASQDIGLNYIVVVDELPQGASVIAHRGYWNVDGDANSENSRYSVSKAVECGFFGAEIDVWMTTDGYLMVNHDSSYDGVTIQSSTYSDCASLTLDNGETMPQLKDILDIISASDKNTKLIIEIKEHSTTSANQAAASAIVEAVKEYGLEDYVEYISFSEVACLQVVSDDADASVAYLSGDKSPSTLYAEGITGIDYAQSVLESNTDWITEAHELGMKVNTWTIDGSADINTMTLLDVDYITTNTPDVATTIKNYYDSNQ